MTKTTISSGDEGDEQVTNLVRSSPALHSESDEVTNFSYSSLENNNTKVHHRNTKSYCLYPPCKFVTSSPFFGKTTGAFVKIKHESFTKSFTYSSPILHLFVKSVTGLFEVV